MRRFIQLVKLIFSSNIYAATEHYEDNRLILHYKELTNAGLSVDEEGAYRDFKNLDFENITVIGAGTGRECKVFSHLGKAIWGVEPVAGMRSSAFSSDNIKYLKDLNEIPNESSDIVFVTKFLPSFLNLKERHQFYTELKRIMSQKSILYIKPDIMTIDFRYATRYYIASILLKIFHKNKYFEKGDTLRVNLDCFIGDGHFVFYHYFQSEEVFREELRLNGFEVRNFSDGFFKANLI